MAASSIHTFESSMSMPLMTLPLRCTAVKHGDRLIIISPIKFSDTDIKKLKDLGGVTDIVAPSLLHHLSVRRTKDLFPNAKAWGVPGLKEKCPDLPLDAVLSRELWPYSDFLELFLLTGGKKFQEATFVYKPERTLIVSDLCFNIRPDGRLGQRLILTMFGTYKRFGVSRLLKMYISDTAAFKASLGPLLASDFDRVIMGHGEIVASGGKPLLQGALHARGY